MNPKSPARKSSPKKAAKKSAPKVKKAAKKVAKKVSKPASKKAATKKSGGKMNARTTAAKKKAIARTKQSAAKSKSKTMSRTMVKKTAVKSTAGKRSMTKKSRSKKATTSRVAVTTESRPVLQTMFGGKPTRAKGGVLRKAERPPLGSKAAGIREIMFAEDMTEVVGNTPLVRLRVLTKEWGIKGTILVKPEFLNPTGSVKDRMAIFLLRQAERKGELKPAGTIVEATSGNTGAAVAMYAAAHGYKAILTIPDKMSKEKIDTLKAFGAQVFVCPTAVEPTDPQSYYETAKRIARETPNSYFVGQYFNLDNIEAHYRTTGPEIWRQTNGKLDILVGGIGTGGTVSGTAKFLKEQNPNIKVVAADPEGSVYYHFFKTGEMPEAHTYLVEGIGDDFLCPTLDLSVIDEVYQVSDKECFLMARDLARKEGIMGGGSSGGIVLAALKYARDIDMADDQLMVVILPDHGAKYITKMFNDEWMREKGIIE